MSLGRLAISSKAAMIGAAVAATLLCPIWSTACGANSKKVTVPADCPAPRTLASLTGSTFGNPFERRTSVSLVCLYQRGGEPLSIAINASNVTSKQFRAAEQAAASASHLQSSTVANLGSAAYVTGPNGSGETEIAVLADSHVITLAGSLTVSEAEAIAHYVVSHDGG